MNKNFNALYARVSEFHNTRCDNIEHEPSQLFPQPLATSYMVAGVDPMRVVAVPLTDSVAVIAEHLGKVSFNGAYIQDGNLENYLKELINIIPPSTNKLEISGLLVPWSTT